MAKERKKISWLRIFLGVAGVIVVPVLAIYLLGFLILTAQGRFTLFVPPKDLVAATRTSAIAAAHEALTDRLNLAGHPQVWFMGDEGAGTPVPWSAPDKSDFTVREMVERDLPIIAWGKLSAAIPRVYYEEGRPVVDPDDITWDRTTPYQVHLKWHRDRQQWEVLRATLGEGKREFFATEAAPRFYSGNLPKQTSKQPE